MDKVAKIELRNMLLMLAQDGAVSVQTGPDGSQLCAWNHRAPGHLVRTTVWLSGDVVNCVGESAGEALLRAHAGALARCLDLVPLREVRNRLIEATAVLFLVLGVAGYLHDLKAGIPAFASTLALSWFLWLIPKVRAAAIRHAVRLGIWYFQRKLKETRAAKELKEA